jgi:hypothetical protein
LLQNSPQDTSIIAECNTWGIKIKSFRDIAKMLSFRKFAYLVDRFWKKYRSKRVVSTRFTSIANHWVWDDHTVIEEEVGPRLTSTGLCDTHFRGSVQELI